MVSIGNHDSIGVLRSIVGKDGNLFKFDNVDKVVSAQTKLAKIVCKGRQRKFFKMFYKF